MPYSNTIFIAPDKFKGTLSAGQAASAMQAGIQRAQTQLTGNVVPKIELLPLADGGEGSLATLAKMRPDLRTECLQLPDANGHYRPTAFLSNDTTAYFETARLLSLRYPGNRSGSVIQRSSHGLGVFCKKQFAQHRSLAIFVGGTAVCDGGFGALRALGFEFETNSGERISNLTQLRQADRLLRSPTLETQRVTILTDVTAPLSGPSGAARLFGPQKGATPEEVEELELAIAHLAELLRRALPDLANPLPAGIGAGGGIGLALLATCGRKWQIKSGADFLLELSGLEEKLQPGDLLITGEGRTDRGTLAGKLVERLRALALRRRARFMVVSGSLADPDDLQKAGYTHLHAAGTVPPPDSRQAAADLTVATEVAFLEFAQAQKDSS